MEDRDRVLTDDLALEVLSVVADIPEGRVATYGQIARLIGRRRNARLVGKILSQAQDYGDFPCHRVVNAAGRLAPDSARGTVTHARRHDDGGRAGVTLPRPPSRR